MKGFFHERNAHSGFTINHKVFVHDSTFCAPPPPRLHVMTPDSSAMPLNPYLISVLEFFMSNYKYAFSLAKRSQIGQETEIL